MFFHPSIVFVFGCGLFVQCSVRYLRKCEAKMSAFIFFFGPRTERTDKFRNFFLSFHLAVKQCSVSDIFVANCNPLGGFLLLLQLKLAGQTSITPLQSHFLQVSSLFVFVFILVEFFFVFLD